MVYRRMDTDRLRKSRVRGEGGLGGGLDRRLRGITE